MVYSHTLGRYFWRNLTDSCWQITTFSLFWVMLVLLAWSNIEAWYIPSCFSIETSNNINAIIENIACGYIVFYFTYVTTSLVPALVGKRQHRVMLAENARRLYDSVSTFYENLFQVGYKKEETDTPVFYEFYKNNCWCKTGKYQLKECNHKVIIDNEQSILQYQKVIEAGYEDLFLDERENLLKLQLAGMWKLIEQLKYQQYLFPCKKWENLSKEIVCYLRLTKRLQESLRGKNTEKNGTDEINGIPYHGLNINLFSINNNSFNQW